MSKILEEGKLLFRLEKDSWYGTDYFLENFPIKKTQLAAMCPMKHLIIR